ncbi:MAG: radical SAM family heme chaperone HemW [Parvibaculales bacterium]
MPNMAPDRVATGVKPPLGIYLHWPFCTAICPYCDFNVHVARHANDVDAQVWATAYAAELRHAHGLRPDGPVQTVFFGGGTPSLMSADLVGAILQTIDALWGLADKAEISLEANPSPRHGPMQVSDVYLRDLRAAGVRRLSLGAQAFDDAALKKLGRAHSAAEARETFLLAQKIFPYSSFDLIYARPGQSLAAWQNELQAALALAPQHMSLYQLTIEPDTPFAGLAAKGQLALPDEDMAADFYELTQTLCEAAGLSAYEVSNHAASGHACRHNMASWQGGDYLGIGPGAHGRLTRLGRRWASQALRAPHAWREQVNAQGHGWENLTPLDAEAHQMEAVMLGLRLTDGISLADLAARHVVLDDARLAAARADGLLSDDPQKLQASRQGRLLLDTLIARLLLD